MKQPFVQNYTEILCGFCGEMLRFQRLDQDMLEFHHSAVDGLVEWDFPIEFCPNNAAVLQLDTHTMTLKNIPYYMARFV